VLAAIPDWSHLATLAKHSLLFQLFLLLPRSRSIKDVVAVSSGSGYYGTFPSLPRHHPLAMHALCHRAYKAAKILPSLHGSIHGTLPMIHGTV